VQKVNPAKTPQVVGGLLDCEADESFISNLIMSVRSLLPVGELCAEVEKRNRLRLLEKFLQLLVQEGSTDPQVRAACNHGARALSSMLHACASARCRHLQLRAHSDHVTARRAMRTAGRCAMPSRGGARSPLPATDNCVAAGAQRDGQDPDRRELQPGALPPEQPLLRARHRRQVLREAVRFSCRLHLMWQCC
jgi:hypothetical protein